MYCKKRVKYYTVDIDNDTEHIWVYSAEELEECLSAACAGQRVRRVLVSLYGHLERLEWYRFKAPVENYLDFSYMGGSILVLFDKIALELAVHVEGMMSYRLMPIWDVRVCANAHIDYPPSNIMMNGDNSFRDLYDDLTLPYESQAIEGVTVFRTDMWAFNLRGWDKALADIAAEKNDLPSSIAFRLENGNSLIIEGDDYEYFRIKLQPSNT